MTTAIVKTDGNGRMFATAPVGDAEVTFRLRGEGPDGGESDAAWTLSGDVDADAWQDVLTAVSACARRLAGDDVEFVSGPDADADIAGKRHVRVRSSQL